MGFQKNTKLCHFMMLKYWHRFANQELKEHYRLPEVGETFEGLLRRNLTSKDVEYIEACYWELRGLIKIHYGGKIEELA